MAVRSSSGALSISRQRMDAHSADLPLSPAMIATLQQRAAGERGCGVGCAVASLVVGGVCLLLSLAHLLDWDPLAIASLAAIAIAVSFLSGIVREQIIRADLRAGVYRRITGPVSVTETRGDEDQVSFTLRVGPHSFPLEEGAVERLRAVRWGSIEYAPRSRIVFALPATSGHETTRSPAPRTPRTPRSGGDAP
jgi:hypothetical protein